MATAALSTGQYGTPAIGGLAHMAIMTVTPGESATAGESLDLTSYFSTIDAIQICGFSAAALAIYQPDLQFTAGAATTSTGVKLFWRTHDGDAGLPNPDNGTDLSAVGTMQIMVFGKAA